MLQTSCNCCSSKNPAQADNVSATQGGGSVEETEILDLSTKFKRVPNDSVININNIKCNTFLKCQLI